MSSGNSHDEHTAAKRQEYVVSNAQALREYADAVDKDRGHSKSMLTTIMRDAANEIERLRGTIARAEARGVL